MMIGIAYRHGMRRWMASCPREISCLEITAEHFFDAGEDLLHSLARTHPLFVHGLGLSLGTPGPLDEDTLSRFAHIAKAANARWISDHVAFTRAGGVDLGHLNPVRPCQESLRILVDHAVEVKERCGRPLILENITSRLNLDGDMRETEFLNHLCREADCGLLLDVTNLFINSRNHDYDPIAWLDEIEAKRIVQLHIVGYAQEGGCYTDSHGARIQDELLELLGEILERAPVQAVILERDDPGADPVELALELQKLEAVCERRGNLK